MAEPYPSQEKRYWEERIRDGDRYTSIGRRSLPDRINRLRKEALFEVIDEALARSAVDLPRSRVLDAGCGTGVYAERYTAAGARVVGVDLSHEGILSTVRHGVTGHFCVGTLSDLPFSGGSFDLTHVFSVLYHIVDDREWRASLDELCRVTGSGGALLMRIEWVEESVRVAEHVKHRSRQRYLDALTVDHGLVLEGVHAFRDVVRFQPLLALAQRMLPRGASDRVARFANRFDLLRENPSQKVVLFRNP